MGYLLIKLKNKMEEKKPDQNMMNNILIDIIKENNKMRKRSFLIKTSLYIFFIFLFMFFLNSSTDNGANKHTAIIRISGEISAGSPSNASNIIKSIKKAYANKNVEGIVLEINSPGGSGVQAQMVYKGLIRLKKKYPN